MVEPGYFFAAVAAAAAVTFALRALPFAIKGTVKDSAFLEQARQWLPLGAIVILCLYAMMSIDLAAAPHGLPELSGIVVTAAVHLWRKNALLSMASGTAVCLFLSNIVFA